jgi:hypothetical protein
MILREVLMILLIVFESSGYQCQAGIKHPQHKSHVSFLGDTLTLLHILQGVKGSALRGLKLLIN